MKMYLKKKQNLFIIVPESSGFTGNAVYTYSEPARLSKYRIFFNKI